MIKNISRYFIFKMLLTRDNISLLSCCLELHLNSFFILNSILNLTSIQFSIHRGKSQNNKFKIKLLIIKPLNPIDDFANLKNINTYLAFQYKVFGLDWWFNFTNSFKFLMFFFNHDKKKRISHVNDVLLPNIYHINDRKLDRP